MLHFPFSLILLCGGASSRMGHLGPKGLLAFRGHPWFLRQIQRFPADVILVLGYDAHLYDAYLPLLPQNCRVVYNKSPERGSFSSLQEGLKAFNQQEGKKGAFIGPIDVPLPPFEVCQKMATFFEEQDLLALAPYLLGKGGGHPVLVSSKLTPSWATLDPLDGNSRLDFLLKTIPEKKFQKFALDEKESDLLENLNTPEKWKNYCLSHG